MTKQDLVNQVAKSTGIEKTAVQLVIDETSDAIQQAVSKGDSVIMRGFGSFIAQYSASKTARNLSTGEEVHVPARYIPKFKPSKEFKENVSKLTK